MKFDMSLDELKTYNGRLPKPDHFDEFWSRGLAELEEQSLAYELIPAEFQTRSAECFHLFFTGTGGAKIHCQLVRPKNQSEKGPGLVLFHGYHGNSGDWVEKIGYAAEGFTVLAMDCRGQSGQSEDNLQAKGSTLKGHIIRGIKEGPEELYYRNVFLDTVQAARILFSMENVDADRVGVQGASQGGALSIACAALEPRIKKAAVAYPFLSDYKRAWELDISQSAYEEIHYYFRFIDPVHEKENELFESLGFIDIQHLADRVQADVLWAVGMEDQICPPSTQFAAYNKLTSQKEMLIFYEYGHEHLRTFGDRSFSFLASLLEKTESSRGGHIAKNVKVGDNNLRNV
ncbi:acetylxylan esterase [Fictibacillus fluitans]|uniref:Acetylxylan esterase n=1 Tax=Fictibacillus fluitans TaxID=3058422 RepID=A0ABT8I0W3_9BACL|nr:alpha/beta fold hydrolase [Fictibacillus sp. NE201]MDN4526676.1 acetylxylan esterase [Fictibacillus sp. NE201]